MKIIIKLQKNAKLEKQAIEGILTFLGAIDVVVEDKDLVDVKEVVVVFSLENADFSLIRDAFISNLNFQGLISLEEEKKTSGSSQEKKSTTLKMIEDLQSPVDNLSQSSLSNSHKWPASAMSESWGGRNNQMMPIIVSGLTLSLTKLTVTTVSTITKTAELKTLLDKFGAVNYRLLSAQQFVFYIASEICYPDRIKSGIETLLGGKIKIVESYHHIGIPNKSSNTVANVGFLIEFKEGFDKKILQTLSSSYFSKEFQEIIDCSNGRFILVCNGAEERLQYIQSIISTHSVILNLIPGVDLILGRFQPILDKLTLNKNQSTLDGYRKLITDVNQDIDKIIESLQRSPDFNIIGVGLMQASEILKASNANKNLSELKDVVQGLIELFEMLISKVKPSSVSYAQSLDSDNNNSNATVNKTSIPKDASSIKEQLTSDLIPQLLTLILDDSNRSSFDKCIKTLNDSLIRIEQIIQMLRQHQLDAKVEEYLPKLEQYVSRIPSIVDENNKLNSKSESPPLSTLSTQTQLLFDDLAMMLDEMSGSLDFLPSSFQMG